MTIWRSRRSKKAFRRRGSPLGLTHHSDRGLQHASKDDEGLLKLNSGSRPELNASRDRTDEDSCPLLFIATSTRSSRLLARIRGRVSAGPQNRQVLMCSAAPGTEAHSESRTIGDGRPLILHLAICHGSMSRYPKRGMRGTTLRGTYG
jgi:transposase InsO family protein